LSEQEQVLIEPQTEPFSHPLPGVESKGALAGFVTFVLIGALVVTMALSYLRSGEIVTLKVNGDVWQTRTHQRTVGAFLREVGLNLQPADIVLAPLGTWLEENQTIVVQKALPVLIEADGQVFEHYTHSRQVVDLLREAGLSPKPYDLVTLDGKAVDLDAPLPHYRWTPSRWPLFRSLARGLMNIPASSRLRIKLQRAVPLTINDGGTYTTIYTVARTVGEALLSQDIVLYLGDQVQPLLGTLLTTGLHVEIHRAKPVVIQVDGRGIKTRSHARNVAQLLSEAAVELLGKDYTIPALDAEITPDMTVHVVRVVEDWIWETEDIPFETIWRSDKTLELDRQRTDQAGRVGVRKRRIRIVYEDGEEKERAVTDEWIERQPTTCIKSYGAKIVIRELETPAGIIRYWRKVRMLATSYTAATAGKEPDDPTYGITRLGWQAKRGVVAVDSQVINLGSNVYVPGYGLGTAADTGGSIKGRWIDLCYNEDDWVPWKKWVDVYLLEPIPPVDKINWVLPNYPRERR